MVSIVIPLLNEERSVRELHQRLLSVFSRVTDAVEFILVDDGSTDETFREIQKLSPVVAIRLKRNYGQTYAIAEGVRIARGAYIVTLDGDLENLPEDIPRLLAKIEDGFDVVSGWRKNRWPGKFFTRRLPSSCANFLISFVSGVRLHDHGCTLKAYRAPIVKNLSLSGNMHRMLAAYAAREGARVTEIEVSFTPRKHGTSKYGLSRTFTVILDILAFHFFYKYARRPIHFFGGVGFASFFAGGIAFFLMLYFKYFRNTTFIETPLPVVVALAFMVGFQFILMGLLAELVVRLRPQDGVIVAETIER